MNRPKLTRHDIECHTGMSIARAKDVTRSVEAYNTDATKIARLAHGECRVCYYINGARVGGAAMTNWNCRVCDDQHMHGSTAVPKLCLACSNKHNLCTQCGGDRDLNTRRRKFPGEGL